MRDLGPFRVMPENTSVTGELLGIDLIGSSQRVKRAFNRGQSALFLRQMLAFELRVRLGGWVPCFVDGNAKNITSLSFGG